MTSGIAEPKRVYLKHHHQHLGRLQKEGDEDSPWISGEELKTDGSSDDEEKGGAKPKLIKKLRKQSCIKMPKKEAPGSCHSKEQVKTSSSVTKAERSAAIKIPRIIHKHASSSSSAEEKVGRSQSLTESLNLENRWRPKRGSLRLPSLTAGESLVDNNNANTTLEDGDKFYKEMQAKIDRLKENPRLEKILVETKEQTQRKKILKKIRSTIAAIETNQAETSSLIRTMRQERHQAQEHSAMWTSSSTAHHHHGLSAVVSNPNLLEMCDRNPQLFLDMLRFEENSQISADEEEMEECERNADFEKSLKAPPGKRHGEQQEDGGGEGEGGPTGSGQNFVQRNIELAAKAMTSFPLTDDEKQKLDELLKGIDAEGTEEVEETRVHLVPSRSLLPALCRAETENDENEGDDQNVLSNAFCMSDEDKQRIGEINVELEKFEETQLLRDSSRNGDDFWRTLQLSQSLKEVDAKLENLRLQDGDESSSSSFTDQ